MELLVSMVIMAVVMLGLAYAYIITNQRNVIDFQRQQGEHALQGLSERLRAVEYDDITDQPATLPALELDNTTNLNDYCDPSDNSTPEDPYCSGSFVYRSSSVLGSGKVDYEIVYKVFDTQTYIEATSEYLDLDAKTIIATICWSSKGKMSYLTRKTVIQEGGL
jgi:type II secretory pathway pseudopilin PulG